MGHPNPSYFPECNPILTFFFLNNLKSLFDLTKDLKKKVIMIFFEIDRCDMVIHVILMCCYLWFVTSETYLTSIKIEHLEKKTYKK